MTTQQADAPSRHRPDQRRIRRWGRVRRGGVWTLGGLLSVSALALTTTAVLDARDLRRPPPGELVELSDGRVLHLQVAGVEHGGPVVVLDAGQGLFSPAFAWLQAQLAEHATVVSYDRPGYGWSTPADRPVDAASTVDDLHEALTTRSLDGPYLLVGHSLGAFCARTFAARYPDQTLGLVLLDPAHAEQMDRLPREARDAYEQAAAQLRWAARLARLGVFRLVNPQEAATVDLPDEAARQIVSVAAAARYWQAAAEEVDAFDALAAAPPDGLEDVPVMVISAGRDAPGSPPIREVLDELHQELAARSARATHHVVEDADHLSLLTVREHAQAVAELVTQQLPTP